MAEVLIAALLGFLFALFLQTYFAVRLARNDQIDDHLEDLAQIEELSTYYWLEAANLDSSDAAREISAAKLRGKLHAARLFSSNARSLLGDDVDNFMELDTRLFMAATGGYFQTARAEQDFVRADEVMAICAEMRTLLRISKRKMFWAR